MAEAERRIGELERELAALRKLVEELKQMIPVPG